MSNRSAVTKSAFEGLRPSIVREPVRTPIAPQDESKLLELQASVAPTPIIQTTPQTEVEQERTLPSVPFTGTTLLTKKKREVLIPLTFRIPQTLKEELNEVAKRHEINQTDLINEGIQLNLQRYR